MTDLTQLIEKVKQSDQAAFEELYNVYYQMGFSLALQFVKNEEEAMDIMQDSFMTICTKLDTLDDANKFKSWYMQIVANKCRDFLKKKNPLSFTDANAYDDDGNLQFDIEDDDRDFQPEESVDYAETVRIVEGMLNELPEDQKMCLLLYYVNGLKISEIAESLGVSEATVKSRLKYGKDKLKLKVEEYEEENNIKLHSIGIFGILPFIRWMFNKDEKSSNIEPPVAHFEELCKSNGFTAANEFAKVKLPSQPLKFRLVDLFGKVASFVEQNKVATITVASVLVVSTVGGAAFTAFPNSKKEDINKPNSDLATSIITSSEISSDNSIDSIVSNEETESKTDSVEEKPQEAKLEVLDIWFDEDYILYTANVNILCGARNGKYGATDLEGNIIIPFKHQKMTAPTEDGYVLATDISEEEKNGKTYKITTQKIYDVKGNVVYKTKSKAKIIVYNEGEENEWTREARYSGERIDHYNDGVLVTHTSNENEEDYWSEYLHLKKLDGTLIKTYDKVLGYVGFKNGKMAISFYEFKKDNIIVINKKCKVLYSTKIHDGDGLDIYQHSWSSGIDGGYILANVRPTPIYYLLNEKLTEANEVEGAYYDKKNNYAEARLQYHFGKFLVYQWSESKKYFLTTISNKSESGFKQFNNKEYDEIRFNSYLDEEVKYAVVKKNEKEGFLSLEDKSEKFYDYVGSFMKGKSIVSKKGKTYIVNEKFERISPILNDKVTNINTIGDNIYAVSIKGKSYPVLFTPKN